MLDQYKFKKEKLIRNLIDRLISLSMMFERSVRTIKMIIDRFYANEMNQIEKQPLNDELSELERVLA